MATADLTAARLRELLHYDPATGQFTRKIRTAQRHQVGDRADFLIATGPLLGYFRVSIDSKRYLAHRVAWLYMHGSWPVDQIDHINGNRSDNRIENLRDVSQQLNRENIRGPQKDNASGYLGVHFAQNLWYAKVQHHGKTVYISSHKTPEIAHAAYVKAKREHHEGCTL